MVKYRDCEHSSIFLLSLFLPLPFLFVISFFLSSVRTLLICLSLSTSVYSVFPFLLSSSCFIYHSISPFRIVQFISILVPSSFHVWYHLFLQLDEDNVRVTFASGTTSSFSSIPSRASPLRLFLFLFREANKALLDGILCWIRS